MTVPGTRAEDEQVSRRTMIVRAIVAGWAAIALLLVLATWLLVQRGLAATSPILLFSGAVCALAAMRWTLDGIRFARRRAQFRRDGAAPATRPKIVVRVERSDS